MAAHREAEDRQFGVVNVQRGFDQGGSGLEAGRKNYEASLRGKRIGEKRSRLHRDE